MLNKSAKRIKNDEKVLESVQKFVPAAPCTKVA